MATRPVSIVKPDEMDDDVIDKDKVKSFWDARARTYQSLPFESIANLEQDPKNLELKIQLETAKVFDWLPPMTGKSILDLGAGVGQWTFRFVDRQASHVTAVEYSEPLAEIGRKEAQARRLANVDFVVSGAEQFRTSKDFDIVFISGLFVYLNDDQSAALMQNLPSFCRPDTVVLLRDGTGLEVRHEIRDQHSQHLNAQYSATYRTRDEYVALFAAAGFVLRRDENMFLDPCPLNKYPETRLRIYKFERNR